jgi:hypothetical protein
MPIEIIAPLIALTGVILSTLISYIVSVRQSQSELRKVRTEIHREFGGKLFEKRLEVYPELYALLSSFVKVIQSGKVSNVAVNDFLSKWQDWDSKNALFFGRITGDLSYRVRQEFIDLAHKSDEALKKELGSDEALKVLKKKVGQLELALKHELGVFDFERPDPFESTELYDTYRAASSRSKQ